MKFLGVLNFVVLVVVAAVTYREPKDPPTMYKRMNSANPHIDRRWIHHTGKVLPHPTQESVQLWPSDQDGHYRIPYCYWKNTTRDAIKNELDRAWDLWRKGLEGISKFTFEETSKDGQPLPCSPDEPENAELIVPKNSTLFVHNREDHISNGIYSAHGYRNCERCNLFYFRAQDPTHVIARQLGTIFGLGYEHNRPDRDDHVYFNCAGLADYWGVKAKFNLPNMGSACNGPDRGPNFRPDLYKKYDAVQGSKSSTYDFKSIMHFHSAENARAECKPDNQSNNFCPLLRYTGKYKGPLVPMEFIHPNTKPSEMDAQAIKALYPD